MKFRDLKINIKLYICSFAFLLPLGIMLAFLIPMSFSSINKDINELKGIYILRPSFSLMQIIPQYVRFAVDKSTGDADFAREHTIQLLNELNDKYYSYFGYEVSLVSPRALDENWDHILNTKIRNTVLWAYRQMMLDLIKLIAFVTDVSGLVTDSEIESAYLVAAAVHELPQAQERIITIGNLLRTIEDGEFTEKRKEELFRSLDLLIYSDNTRVQNRFSSIETLRYRNNESFESFELLLKASYDRIAYFAEAVDYVINEDIYNYDKFSALFEAAANANNSIYRLQSASLDRLETLINYRIKIYQRRLILSLSTVFIATFIAFFFSIYTTLSIRKSTDIMGAVFRKLHENDLSVKIQTLSGDELGEFMSSMSGFLEKLQIAFSSFHRNASMVTSVVTELSSSAREITITANEQSASVAEIVTTMETNKEISSQASEKTEEVAHLAEETRELSRKGAHLRDVNENVMFDIRSQNVKIIEIIRNLVDMLSRIDESLQIIDTISDQTKLIAFNAALEASSAGEAGARFSVVASEIRRFADNVAESAAEIKEKISELHEASQSLITEANNGSRAIDSGYNRMVEQKEVFENIVDVSQNVAIRCQQISLLSKQQEKAFSQVFLTLKEISSGINHFVSSTTLTSATVDKLNKMSDELKDTLSKYHTTDRSGYER